MLRWHFATCCIWQKNEVMKNTEIKERLPLVFSRLLAIAVMVLASVFGLCAQNSLPAPGWGGGTQNSVPAPGAGGSFRPAPIAPAPPPSWGNPWGPGWNTSPGIVINSPSWVNQGTANVIACGYGARGVWRTIPLHVAYYYNGVDYDVTVLNAWNPWTQMWNRGINQAAYNTSYFINGNTYDFYVPLSFGTFYFNL